MPDTTPAKTALARFTDSLTTKTLRLRDEFNIENTNEVWLNFYYSVTPKNAAKVIAAWPAMAPQITAIMNELDTLSAARKVELAAEKARKAAKRAKYEAAAKAVTSNGIRLNKVHPDTFDTMNKALTDARAEYVARVIESKLAQLVYFRETFAKMVAGDKGLFTRFLRESAMAHRVVDRFFNIATSVIKADAEQIVTNDATREANGSFDGYLIKLATKVGKPIAKASLTGSLWNHSILDIETTDGEVQKWKTQCILNTSILNNLYNQWPTIRLS